MAGFGWFGVVFCVWCWLSMELTVFRSHLHEKVERGSGMERVGRRKWKKKMEVELVK